MAKKLSFLKNPVVMLLCAITVLLVVFQFLPAAQYFTIPKTLSTLAQKLKTWLPDERELPGSFTQSSLFESTNEMIANAQENSQTMLSHLSDWDHLSGLVVRYAPVDPCAKTGLRELDLNIVQHKSSTGAQKYIEWSRQDDAQYYSNVTDIEIGEYAYQAWGDTSNDCPSAQDERQVSILFRRNTAMGVVNAAAAKATNSDADLLNWALEIARILDAHLAAVTQP